MRKARPQSKRGVTVFAVFLLVLFFGLTSRAGVFTNGSFELGLTNVSLALTNGSTNLLGWTIGGVTDGPILWSSGPGRPDGTNDLTFNSGDKSSGAWIAQAFDTLVGNGYDVTFFVGRSGGGGGSVSITASAKSNGTNVIAQTNAVPPGQGYGSVQHFLFTATASTTRLEFSDTNSVTGGVDVLLDNIAVRSLGHVPGFPLLVITNPLADHFLIPDGETLRLEPGVDGALPFIFQWRYANTNLPAQTNAALTIPLFTAANTGSYSLVISNSFGSITSAPTQVILVAPNGDEDGDGLSNLFEFRLGTLLDAKDTDQDGLDDDKELFLYGTNPLLKDTDGDGMPDGWEILYGLNPLVNDANDDLDLDGLTNLQEYQMWLTNNVQRPDRPDSIGDGKSDYERLFGTQTNRFYYDRNDRLVGVDYNRGSNGFAIAYVYDGNGNLLRQKNLARDANHNGLPDVWEFLHGLTNNASAYADTDRDGWSDFQEWKAGSDPSNPNSRPDLLGNPGLNIASNVWTFTPSNFVVGVGQLDGVGAEEIVIGTDGNPGTNNNFLLIFTQNSSSWSTQRVDIGPFGVTSIAVGQLANRPAPAMYAGLRGTTNGSGRIIELMNVARVWQTNLVATSTNETAFVLGVRGQDVLASLAASNASDGALYALGFSTNWTMQLFDPRPSHRGLGRLGSVNPNGNLVSVRLSDAGGILCYGVGSGLTEGLVAYWSFDDGTAADNSGNGNGGTIMGGAVPVAGRVGQALSFDGIDDFVSLSSRPSLPYGSTPRTIAMWLYTRANSWGDYHLPFEYGTPAARSGFAINLSTYPSLDFYTWNGDMRVTNGDVALDEWFHIAFSYDGNVTLKAFVNGVERGSTNLGSMLTTSTTDFRLGRALNAGPAYFVGLIDEVRIYRRALNSAEILQLITPSGILAEPSAARTNNWRGWSLDSGSMRATNGISIFYTFVDDKNANGVVDFADEFVTAEYLVSGTNASVLTSSRHSIASATAAKSYGLASVNFLNRSNEVLFTGEPDGRVFAWTATGATNPLQRQLFSAQYAGKGWHALAGVKALEPGESLVGLVVDPKAPEKCDVIFWRSESQLPQTVEPPQTAPLARVLPFPPSGGNLANIRIRLWDAEGNMALPFLQFSPDRTNWFDVTNIAQVDSLPYNLSTRVTALPAGSDHSLWWNAGAEEFGTGVTNIFLRARARDVSLLGDWSEPMPYQLTIMMDSDGDGIPDSWEMANGLDPNRNDANEDKDGDGFSNLSEYLAGTDPTDPNSSLRITLIQPLPPAALQIHWRGGTSGTPVLQTNLSLLLRSNQWFDFLTNTMPGTNGTFTVSNLPSAGVFEGFRLRLEQ